jgi:hypothetical protein
MTSEYRITPGLITDVPAALEGHGYVRHAERLIGLIGDLARIWEGTQDHPATACPVPMPLSPPAYPEPSRHDTITLTRTDASTMLVALDIAADDKRYCAELCLVRLDRSCHGCQTHLAARAVDQVADRILQAASAVSASRTGPDRRPQPATGRETGQ